MSLRFDDVREGDMLLSPGRQLYVVEHSARIVLDFRVEEQLEPDPSYHPDDYVSHLLYMKSLDGLSRVPLHASGRDACLPDGWEPIAGTPRER